MPYPSRYGIVISLSHVTHGLSAVSCCTVLMKMLSPFIKTYFTTVLDVASMTSISRGLRVTITGLL
ncbi:DUF1270 family protein [Pectobacterium parmentieri]|uniref:DUF1270 family protein n=1 Tax=Pectobacterium parmentieri TaxID=1905730 RepID=A0ABS0S3T0_PECPM|nr:DUF1270 family protein [Pectobacterium parmentieri]MBI0494666.1 DUF1270 family protein [Pectobacterium parmentieri]MBI0518109.1 DUF1270 family protein [Pectobacterium parmentieri]MBI0551283.1 DUF1270 family protein [Pectobacterium parmentieri]MBI0555902.1 DUF1270 family protein [Pectobacterium parmentieri]